MRAVFLSRFAKSAHLTSGVVVALGFLLAGCATEEPPPPLVIAPPIAPVGPKKIALLVPLTGPNAGLGQALQRAASLALGGADGPSLDVRDTGGDPLRAANAARDAIIAGDPLILGPLTAGETAAVAGAAGGVPVLAFTSDPTAASPGVWTMGLTPTQQMQRLAAALRDDGRSKLAAVLPPGAFGDALAQGLTDAAADAGLAPPVIRRSTGGADGFDEAVRDVANADQRHQVVANRLAALKTMSDDASRASAAQEAAEPPGPPPFDALLIAEAGDTLDAALQSLPGYEITMPAVRLLGPAMWAGQAGVHARLRGAWYARPDPAPHHLFVSAFIAKFGATPPPIASLAFDAGAIARVLAHEGDISAVALTRAEGFSGVDGPMVLLGDGHVRRALAVFEASPGGDRVVSPAPDTAAR